MGDTVLPDQAAGRKSFKLTAAPVKASGSAAEAAQSTQTYIDRIKHYIPIEVIAFFVFVNALFDESPATSADEIVAIASLVIAVVGTIVYVNVSSKSNAVAVWGVQASISVLALLVWVYAIDSAPIQLMQVHWGIEHNGKLAGLLLATFTLFSGLVVPTAKADDATAASHGSHP